MSRAGELASIDLEAAVGAEWEEGARRAKHV
jgi:hypothetical protein